MTETDAVVVGAGPNGLTAAITLARSGLAVQVREAAPTIGGGARTEELTLPGFRHDPCSAVHPLGAGSPAFGRFPLERYGLEWVAPELPLAHPFLSGDAATLSRSPESTADSLGVDAPTYRRLIRNLPERWNDLARDVLRAPLAELPAHPTLLAGFALPAVLPASTLCRLFRGPLASALFAGLAAHVIAPLTTPGTAGVALLFALAAHSVGWPFPRGGSQALSNALSGYLSDLDGEIVTEARVRSWSELPPARAYLFDTSPTTLAAIAETHLPAGYLRRLQSYRYGAGVFKVDYAMDGPVPWSNPECQRAGTVHVGGPSQQIGAALRAAQRGSRPDPPFLITAQPSVFDPDRAPRRNHAFWAYAHVPHGFDGDLTTAIDSRIEEFAPGFRDRVLQRAVHSPRALEERNPNYVGGDIACGSFAGMQGILRPVARRVPYTTPDPRIFLCSSATPPGPGVHGMCGYHAARAALERRFGQARRQW